MLIEQFNIHQKYYNNVLGDVSELSILLERIPDGEELEIENKRILWHLKDRNKYVEITIEYIIIDTKLADAEYRVKQVTLHSSNGTKRVHEYSNKDLVVSFEKGLLSLQREFKSPVIIK